MNLRVVGQPPASTPRLRSEPLPPAVFLFVISGSRPVYFVTSVY